MFPDMTFRRRSRERGGCEHRLTCFQVVERPKRVPPDALETPASMSARARAVNRVEVALPAPRLRQAVSRGLG